jgi:3-dehydroquinate dehydratase
MERRKFLRPGGPTIAAIMDGQTPAELIAQARGAEFDGADAVAVSLFELKPEFRNPQSFAGIVNAVPLPFMFYFYRKDFWNVASTDESRQEVLLAAAEGGAAIIDVMGDLYDPSPRENTSSPEAVERQMRLIDQIHARGAQVVISSHVSEALTADEVLAQLQAFERRGPDLVKIVTVINTEAEFLEAVKTTMLLRRELKLPFIHLCNGAFGRMHRFLGLTLGVAATFAVHQYGARNPMTQPTLRAMKAVLENCRWHIDQVPG